MTENQEMAMGYILGLMERETRITKRAALEIENLMQNSHMYAISIIDQKRTTSATLMMMPYELGLVGITLSINAKTIYADFMKTGGFETVEHQRMIQGLLMTIIYREIEHNEEISADDSQVVRWSDMTTMTPGGQEARRPGRAQPSAPALRPHRNSGVDRRN